MIIIGLMLLGIAVLLLLYVSGQLADMSNAITDIQEQLTRKL
jgi:multisubunit Na+/H+ antiporter MnhC subunit